MNEHFTCHQCGCLAHIRQLTKRNNQTGDYCPRCGDLEKCAACGEMFESKDVHYKHDVKNYICNDCQYDYQDVKEYIKPLEHFGFEMANCELKNRAA